MGSGLNNINSIPKKYFALYEDGTNSDWDSFDKAKLISDKICIIEAIPFTLHTTTSGNTYVYHRFIAIDDLHKPVKLLIGKTTCSFIGVEEKDSGSNSDIFPIIEDFHGNRYKVRIYTNACFFENKLKGLVQTMRRIDEFSKICLMEFNSMRVFTNWKEDPMKVDVGMYWKGLK
jgi:hypothetical protein